MQFRTELQLPHSSVSITHKTDVLTLGSCFADVIGSKLEYHKFSVLKNPFGTIFNPESLGFLLDAALKEQPLPKESYIQTRDTWFNFHIHSNIYAETQALLEENINQILKQVREKLLKGQVLILTLGTAYVYKHLQSQKTVANCHKLPGSSFVKVLLKVEEISASLGKVFKEIQKINPELKILISVSPVRHIKDTIPLNSLSKSILRVAANDLVTETGAEYFPAFELMMDDLRDYRFYKEDMIHPTTQAENYIWEKFSSVFFDQETYSRNQELASLLRSLEHKALKPESAEHKLFLDSTLKKLIKLSEFLPLQKEINRINEQLKAF